MHSLESSILSISCIIDNYASGKVVYTSNDLENISVYLKRCATLSHRYEPDEPELDIIDAEKLSLEITEYMSSRGISMFGPPSN